MHDPDYAFTDTSMKLERYFQGTTLPIEIFELLTKFTFFKVTYSNLNYIYSFMIVL